jgi:hypothetical protein
MVHPEAYVPPDHYGEDDDFKDAGELGLGKDDEEWVTRLLTKRVACFQFQSLFPLEGPEAPTVVQIASQSWFDPPLCRGPDVAPLAIWGCIFFF